MPSIFENMSFRKPKYSAFDLSCERKLSFNMGELIPIYCEDLVPGDQFRINTECLLRFSPLIAPVMHRVNVYVHYFFVPNRIIWDEWEDFITGGQDGTTTPSMPELQINTNLANGTLADYLGIGAASYATSGDWKNVIELPFRAYQQIYNDYFIDPNLRAPIDITNDAAIRALRTRGWERDYLTSSLPWTQRGAEVQAPFSFNPSTGEWDEVWNVSGAPALSGAGTLDSSAGGDLVIGANGMTIDNSSSLGMSINDLRQTTALQRWLERNATGGHRYIEQILSHFGVKSPDQRLQRSAYLGGGRQPVTISEVLNTSATATQPQGEMAGHGVSVGNINKANYRATEHGWLFGIMSVLPRTSYQQGVPRKFSKNDRYDYYFPEFAHLGEQEVLNKEVYYDGAGADNDGIFGYQQRYAEYKYGISSVHGDFKSTLDYWHMGRIFSSAPALNDTFTESDPTTRIFAVESGDQLWCQVYNNVKARRPMPYHAKPRLT